MTLTGLKKWGVQWLQLLLLVPAILTDGITLGVQVLSQKLQKQGKNHKWLLWISNILMLGMPKLSELLGKAVAWTQTKINDLIAQLKK